MSISSFSISKRLGLAVILPILLIVYLASLEVETKYRNYVQMIEVSEISESIAEIGEVIHFLQIERGQTVGFLSSKGTSGEAALKESRKKVDHHRAELQLLVSGFGALDKRVSELANTALKSLQQLDNGRRDIDSLAMTGGQSFDYYSKTLRELINFSIELSMTGMSSSVAREILAYNQLMQAKEIAGQERGLGNGFIAASQIAPERLAQFAAFAGAQDSLLDNFLQLQSDEHRENYRKIVTIRKGGNIELVRNRILTGGIYSDLRDLNAAAWFDRTTQRIEGMKKIEEESVARIAAQAQNDAANALHGLKLVIGLLAVGSVVIIFVSALMAMSIVRPVKRLVGAMSAITGGDLREVELGADRGDEIGEMARAVEGFRQAALRNHVLEQEADENRRNAQEQQRIAQERADAEAQRRMDEATSSLARALRQLAAGDLLCEINEPLSAQFEGLRQDFNDSVSQLRDTLLSVEASVFIVNSGAVEISSASDDLSRRTEQQASSLEETAAALEEITVNVKATSQRSDEARNVTREAHQQAGVSGHIVENAVFAMQRIDQSSRQISQIIGVIDEIAFQTNLLALNAGVEAARAGDAGKGFAVVAQEVRDLAQRSANAAREIKVLITNSESAVAEGVKLVSETGTGLADIAALVDRVNVHMNAIATAAQEQAAGLSEVNSAINHMDQSTQQNAAMVEEMNAAGAGLAEESQNLDRLLSAFTLDSAAMRRVA